MSKKMKSYPEEWYEKCFNKLEEIKDIELKGNEYAPAKEALHEFFENGRKPDEVIATMEYLQKEKGFDWKLTPDGSVGNWIAEGVAWKEKQQKKKEERKKKKWEYQTGPSIEEIEEFKKSFANFKKESAHGDSPWAFEFYLDAADVITFEPDNNNNVIIHDIDRYEEANELFDALKDYEDEQIKGEEIEKELSGVLGDEDITDLFN